MSPEKERALFDKYAHMFRGKDMSIQQNLMPFGCEHGDGWFNILDCLCQEIDYVLKLDENSSEGWAKDFIVLQVKEKFGGLRFYISPANEQIHSLISLAEALSYVTCENCGAPGHRRSDGWTYTLCDTCWQKLKEERAAR